MGEQELELARLFCRWCMLLVEAAGGQRAGLSVAALCDALRVGSGVECDCVDVVCKMYVLGLRQ